MKVDDGNILGNNEAKYDTRNPLARRMVAGFLDNVVDLFHQARPRRVLEVGCGEGELATRLVAAAEGLDSYLATDIDLKRIPEGRDSRITLQEASIYDLPFADDSFDTVVCCEVLEHLSDPETAMAEVARVARQWVIVSTPWEPVWRALNMARGKYLGQLGNTPGHIQHFSRGGLRSLVAAHADIHQERRPLPWTMILAAPRSR